MIEVGRIVGLEEKVMALSKVVCQIMGRTTVIPPEVTTNKDRFVNYIGMFWTESIRKDMEKAAGRIYDEAMAAICEKGENTK